jgi:Cof subfamily protein (haloacid dehalogenase superfamily)
MLRRFLRRRKKGGPTHRGTPRRRLPSLPGAVRITAGSKGAVDAVREADARATRREPPPVTDGTLEVARVRVRTALEDLQAAPVLLGLDVDGTLVDHDGAMSPEVHRALNAAAKDAHVVIATGRSIGATLPIARAAGVERGYAVCSNGAVTVRLDPELTDGWEVLSSRTFLPGNALAALREVAPTAHYAVETADGAFFSTPGFQDASFGVQAAEADLDALFALEAVRVVVFVPDLTPEEFGKLISESGIHGVQYAIGWTAWLDMAAPGVSKATALEDVREELGVDRAHTVTVGDGFNDVEMLSWAGVGIAMGQAAPGVKEHADLETLDVWNDGAAEVLRAVVE